MITRLIEIDGETVLDLGEALCEQLGWKVGEILTFKINDDGSGVMTAILSKKEPECKTLEKN